jgi:small redox-active disulfide protein 2
MLSIKVLGPGCANCEKVEEIAKKVVATLSIDATVTKLADRAVWQKYGLLSTPGLVINEKLMCGGRIPSEAEVTTWIANALAVA